MIKFKKLKYLTKNDYLYNRLNHKIYNSFVKEYNMAKSFNRKIEIHSFFRAFVIDQLNKRLSSFRAAEQLNKQIKLEVYND